MFLRTVLADRVARNPAYSLRSLARQLGMAASSLSEVLSGKKKLSLSKAEEIALKLGLDPEEAEHFRLLVRRQMARSPGVREEAERKLGGAPRDLSLDVFRSIADWYHFPILESESLKEPTATRVEPATDLRGPRLFPDPMIFEMIRRDGYRCGYTDTKTGKRCCSQRGLEGDHVIPWARGGKTEVSNGRLMCQKHHSRLSFLQFGEWRAR